jgi:hypothetical protein
MKCLSRIVRNLSNRTGQKSAKFAKGRKSGKYASRSNRGLDDSCPYKKVWHQ